MTRPESPDGPVARVRVTSPRTGAARTHPVPPTSEIDNRSRLGEIYLSSLLRAQLRLAGAVLAVVVVVLAGLPLLFRLLPRLAGTSVLGMPLSWVIMAFAVYPFLFLCGWVYVRRAERNERAFVAMLAPRSAGDDRP